MKPIEALQYFHKLNVGLGIGANGLIVADEDNCLTREDREYLLHNTADIIVEMHRTASQVRAKRCYLRQSRCAIWADVQLA